MKKNVKILLALAVILCACLGVIIGISHNQHTRSFSIVATNFPAYDFARAVAGDSAEIKMLISPGTEVHDFEPTPSDIINIKDSNLFIYTGGESDAWVEDILGDLDTDQTRVLRMMDAVDPLEEESSHGAHEYDEHIWTSLGNSIKIINNIRDELSIISPADRDFFAKNAKNYTDQLSNLDQKFQNLVKDSKRRTLIFADRFPLVYFVNDYGLDYLAAFPGCSEQTEADSRTTALLIDKVKSTKAPAIFKIELSSGQLAETIARETGAKVLTFNTAHNISADDFNRGQTYLEIMEGNLSALEEALR